jgi:hypothetical protein
MNEVAALCPSISLSFAGERCNSLFANLHSDKARVSGSLWKINPGNMSSVEGTVQAYLTLSVHPSRNMFSFILWGYENIRRLLHKERSGVQSHQRNRRRELAGV